jgi:hypothetical protein
VWDAVGIPPGGQDFCSNYPRAASNITTELRKPGARQSSRPSSLQQIGVQTGEGGVATALLKITATGSVFVFVNEVPWSGPRFITITVAGPAAPVTKLKLLPDKTHSGCGEPATLTAMAKDANGAPAANAKVTFSAEGDCQLSNSPEVKITDANGIATYTIGSYQPCRASVVAASVDANGAIVLSDVSHVYFVEGRYSGEREHYGDDREYNRG